MNQAVMEYDAKQVYLTKEMKCSQFNFVLLTFIILFSALSSSPADFWIFCGNPLPFTVRALPLTFSFLCLVYIFRFVRAQVIGHMIVTVSSLSCVVPLPVKASSRVVLETHIISRRCGMNVRRYWTAEEI